MPAKKHLPGVGEKEQRQYEHILESAKKEGRYGKPGQRSRGPNRDEAPQGGGPQEGSVSEEPDTVAPGAKEN